MISGPEFSLSQFPKIQDESVRYGDHYQTYLKPLLARWKDD